MELDEKSLHVLSCDISIRPRNAAGLAEVMPFVRSLNAEGNTVIVQFDQAVKPALESFVGAERLCCTSLSWELSDAQDHLKLTVTGNRQQVSIITEWFRNSA